MNIDDANGIAAASPTDTVEDYATDGAAGPQPKIAPFAPVVGTGKEISSHFLGNIKRIANGATDYAGDVFLIFFDLHVQLDSMGSRQQTVK